MYNNDRPSSFPSLINRGNEQQATMPRKKREEKEWSLKKEKKNKQSR